jgi:hypothetical protein
MHLAEPLPEQLKSAGPASPQGTRSMHAIHDNPEEEEDEWASGYDESINR